MKVAKRVSVLGGDPKEINSPDGWVYPVGPSS